MNLLYSGKVRDIYDAGDDRLLMVTSDRISAFDVVLDEPIPDKGRVLTALTLWWFERLADVVPGHVHSTDVPAAVAGRAMVCRRLEMLPIECVARGYLAGSGWTEYQVEGAICGVALPDGLRDGDRLPEPIFTPATKAVLGEHDENVTFDHVAGLVGEQAAARLRELTLRVYTAGEALARERGIVLADTKLEFGHDPRDPDAGFVLADELLTPDSSRFWPAEAWSPGAAQHSFDKQYVRDWLTSRSAGWDRSSGVPPPPLPDEVVERTRNRYLEAYQRLTGRPWAA